MKLALASDIHCGKLEHYSQIEWPSADVLVIAGDITRFGNSDQLKLLPKWANTTDYKAIIVIAGNHDNIFIRKPVKALDILKKCDRIVYLQDSGYQIGGLTFWGSPWTRGLFKGGWWAFGQPDEMCLKYCWSKIPSNTDILITHSPPRNILDVVKYIDDSGFQYEPEHCGSVSLLVDVADRIRPKIHVFGHIHESHGIHEYNDIQFVNAAIMDIDYKPTNKVRVLDIP